MTYHWIPVRNLEVELDQFMVVERIVRTNNVGLEFQQIIILEVNEVVRVILLELLALLRHALHG